MRASARLLAAACAAAACAAGAAAQDFFDDNELRTDLIALAETVVGLEERAEQLAGQLDRLRSETEQLRRLAQEIEGQLSAGGDKSAQRERRITEVMASAEATIGEHEERAESDSRLLLSILEGIDGREYSAALRGYNSDGDVKGSLRRLRGIVAYGDLSPYAGSARYWIGRINHQQGAPDTARKELGRFLEEHPSDHRAPDAMLMLAEIAGLEDVFEAARIEDEILALHPDSAAADRVRALRQ